MTTGTIARIDVDSGKGYIHPDSDHDGDHIPFELDEVENYPNGKSIEVGDKVSYGVEGGMAGIVAVDIRLLT